MGKQFRKFLDFLLSLELRKEAQARLRGGGGGGIQDFVRIKVHT